MHTLISVQSSIVARISPPMNGCSNERSAKSPICDCLFREGDLYHSNRFLQSGFQAAIKEISFRIFGDSGSQMDTSETTLSLDFDEYVTLSDSIENPCSGNESCNPEVRGKVSELLKISTSPGFPSEAKYRSAKLLSLLVQQHGCFEHDEVLRGVLQYVGEVLDSTPMKKEGLNIELGCYSIERQILCLLMIFVELRQFHRSVADGLKKFIQLSRDVFGPPENLWSVQHYICATSAHMKDWDGALHDLDDWKKSEKGYLHKHSDAFFYQESGVLKRMKGDLPSALEDLNKAFEKHPEDYILHMQRGYVKFLMGDEEGARADAEKGQEFNTDDKVYEPGFRKNWFATTSNVEFLGFDLIN